MKPLYYRGYDLSRHFDMVTSFELFLMLYDAKPLVRLICTKDLLRKLNQLSKRFNFELFSQYKIAPLESKGFINAGKYVSLDVLGGNYVVFVSKDKDLVRYASSHKLIETYELGILLGYPECCVEFYMKNHHKAKQDSFDYTLLSARSDLVESYLTNVCLRSFGFTLLSHFPCAYDCKKSITLAKLHESLLKTYAQDHASTLSKNLRSCIIYSLDLGIHYAKKYKLDVEGISKASFISDNNTSLTASLTKAQKIIIKDYSHIMVDDLVLDERIGLFIFE